MSDASAVDQALRVAASFPSELLAIVGPTATGKTALAVGVADRIGGEIISADSVQVYRHFDVGSGKPTACELATAPHHLVSAIDPMQPIDAAVWSQRAGVAIADVRARGRIPIVCGGTFLWVKALVFGLAQAPAASAQIRARHRAAAEQTGRAALHAELCEVDPDTAARLHPNDLVRVSRALEVRELTGRPLSAWHREHGFATAVRPAQMIALAWDGAALTCRIRERVRRFLSSGWVEEVEALSALGFEDARAMKSVGYAQVRAMLAGDLARADLEEAIVRATRTFARRQRTWLNRANVTWIEP